MCFIVVAVLVIVFYLFYRDTQKPDRFPPGPAWHPIIGCHFEIKLLSQKLGFHYLVLEKLNEKYGPVVGLRLGRDRIILISEHEHVKRILLKDEFDGRPDGFFFRMRSFQKRLGFTENARVKYLEFVKKMITLPANPCGKICDVLFISF